MKIANPIYDVVFRYLMKDKKIVAQMKAEDDFLNVLKHQERELERANEVAEEERRQKEEANEREKEAKIKLARKMLKYKKSTEDIILETGLTKSDIQKLKG